ncbi:Protein of unknown function [Flavobacterium fontis]|uniref:DUF2490 domain-containing protein n=1 Tax=Flavobacterium fontis TaxID=1124188 RepID=A0A1M4XWF6_9FLAO|nr:DUF2490 domain-containing protein [Flavobacterium fontis]SHE97907.1 Protein of unknown function [Flavobacterium fontis]
MKKVNYIIVGFLFCNSLLLAQNNRLNTGETIGWYNYFGTFKVSTKWGVHSEYQFRRAEVIAQPQQHLVRVGINYEPKSNILFRAGYAFIETYPYGEIPINGLGKAFTEHRTFQMVQLGHKEGKINFSHRFMLEQRFVGRYNNAKATTEDEFPFSNRLRYMFRMQTPIFQKEAHQFTYAAAYNEIFIGFGKNVNANVFDQNRLGLLIGHQFDKNLRIEAGYLNQILQFGRQINNQNVFQNNHGLIVNCYLNVDLSKKSGV